MKTRIWLATLALSCCTSLAQAQAQATPVVTDGATTAGTPAAQPAPVNPPSAASIERLLALTNSAQLLRDMETTLEPMLRKSMAHITQHAGEMNLQQQAALNELPGKFARLMRDTLDWEKLKPTFVQIYQESFEQAEVDDLIAFYETPTGQALVRKMPLVMSKSMELTQSQMKDLLPQINKLVRETMQQVQKLENAED